MHHTFTKEHLEQRIAAFTSFVQEQGFMLMSLGIGKYHNHHFLVREQDHLVEVTFSIQGGIYVSVEAGSSSEHWIRPRLIPWIEQEQPRYQGKPSSGGCSFSALASPIVTALASASPAQAHWDESAETLFSDEGYAVAEETGGAADKQWITEQFSEYTPQEAFPSYGRATAPRWVTIPAPTALNGRAGTVVTMEFVFDASQMRLREQFAIHVQRLVAEEGSVVLNTATFPGPPILHQRDNVVKATGRPLTAIQLLLSRPQDEQEQESSSGASKKPGRGASPAE